MLSSIEMFGLTSGELFVVVFIFVAVVSAPYWPRMGEKVAAAFGGDKTRNDERSKNGPK